MALLAALSMTGTAWGQTTVFYDSFNRTDSTTIGSTAGPGTGTWTETNTGNGNFAIGTNMLQLTAGDTDGPSIASIPTTGFLSPWASTLSGNAGTVTWSFNMQTSRSGDLSGFGTGSNGIAVVLASSAANFDTAGSGYAVVWGQGGTPDPIRLVSFNNGIQGTLTNIITASTTPFSNMAQRYVSLGVVYDPATSGWTLRGRDDGASAFSDPSSGLTSLGTATNSTYTSSTITSAGAAVVYTTAGNIFRFDNFRVQVTTPQYWDTDGATAGLGGTGTWDQATTASFNSSNTGAVGTLGTYVANSQAIFAGTAGAVTISDTVTPGAEVRFDTTGYSITGGTLALSSSAPINTNGAGVTTTIGSSLSGANLTKAGAGTLVVTGSNAVSTTTISAGTLQIGDGGTSGQIGSGDVSNAGTLIFNRSDDVTVSVAINGAGAVTKQGAGKLILTGANGYTGATTISAGTLQIGNNGTVGSLASGTSITNNGTLTFNRSDDLTFSNSISGTGSVVKESAGVLTLSGTNTHTGGTTINAGVVSVSSTAALGGSTGNPVVITINAGTLRNTSASTGTIPTFRTFVLGSSTSGIDITNSANVATITTQLTGPGVLNKSGPGTLVLTADNAHGGNNITAGTLSVDDVFALSTATGGSASAPILTTINGGTLQFTANGTSSTTSRGLSIGASNGVVDVSTSTDVVSFGSILQGSGVLTKTGAGTLQFTSLSSTFTGRHQVSAGTLDLTSVSSWGNAGTTTIGAGTLRYSNTIAAASRDSTYLVSLTSSTSTIDISNAGTTFTLNGVVSGASGSLTKAGAGTLTINSASNYAGATNVSAGTLRLGDSGSLAATTTLSISSGASFDLNGRTQTVAGLSGAGAVDLGSGTLTLNKASGTDTFSGSIAGVGSVVKSGAGTLVLSGTTSTHGSTTLSAGTLAIGSDAALGTGAATLQAGTLRSDSTTARTLSNNLTISGNVTLGDAASTGSLTMNGTVDLAAGARQVTTASDVSIGGNVSNGSLAKLGSGTLTLSGSNAQSSTTVSAGTVAIGSNSALGTGTTTLAGGTALRSNSTAGRSIQNNISLTGDVTLGDSTNSGEITTSGTTNLGGATRTITTPSSVTLGGAVSNGSLVKAGAGTLTLGGDNTHTTTMVNAGRVVANHNNALGGGATTVKSGASVIATNGTTIGNAILLQSTTITTGSGSVQWNFSSANSSPSAIATQVLTGGTISGFNGTAEFNTTSASTLGSQTGNAGILAVTQPFSVANSTAFQFTLTPAAGTEVTFGSVRFDARRTSTGPLQYRLRSNLVGTSYDTDVIALQTAGGDGTWTQFGTSAISFTNSIVTSSPATFRLYGSNGSGNPGGANWRIDDLSLSYSFTQTVNSASPAVAGVGDSDSAAFTGAVTVSGSNELTAGSGGVATFSGILSDGSAAGTITKTGLGTVVLAADNTYSGATTVSAGTLKLARQNALYSGSYTKPLLTVSSGATLALNVGGANEFDGSSAGTLASALTGDVSTGGFKGGSTLALDTANATAPQVFSAAIADTTGTGGGAISLAKQGTGTLVLSANNSYSGTTTVSGGTLQIGDGGTTGSVGSGAIVNNAAVVYNRSDDITLDSSKFSGTGSLTQNGATATSTLTLTGSHNYGGATSVTAGELLVNGSLSASTSVVTVSAGATIGGGGTINRPTTINGTLAPGNSAGTLTFGAGLELTDSALVAFELDPTLTTEGANVNDLVNVTGNLTLDGVLSVSGSNASDFTNATQGQTWRLFNYTGSLTNNTLSLGSMPALPESLRWAVVAGSNQVNLTIAPIPEPAVVCGAVLVIGQVLRRRRMAI